MLEFFARWYNSEGLSDKGFHPDIDHSMSTDWTMSQAKVDRVFQNKTILRVVQTEAILFLESSEFRVVLCRIRLFPTLISKIKWLWP